MRRPRVGDSQIKVRRTAHLLRLDHPVANGDITREHLKRVHRVKGHRCNCCLQRWSSLKGLSEHQRSDVHCIKQEDTGDDSIDETQWGKIQERNRGMESATKWTEIYKTIFPLDAVPSPCKFTREGGYEVWPCD